MTDQDSVRLKMDENIVMQLGNKLYNQPKWLVLLRELLQNAIDADAKTIQIYTTPNNMAFEDDGTGMTKEDLLNTFLTVGGSDKDRTRKHIVGGFGIAKLAIFSCEDFEVSSGNWLLKKNMLVDHLPLIETDARVNGTRVDIYSKDLYQFYCAQDQIRQFLSAVDRNVKIHLNGEPVKKAKEEKLAVDGWGAVRYFKPYSSYITSTLVRSNGIPLFYGSVYGDYPGGGIFLFDVDTELTPYDNDYPFSTTRENFRPDCTEGAKYKEFCLAIGKQLKQDKEFEKEKKQALTKDDKSGLWTMYNASITDKSKHIVQIFKNNIELLSTLYDIDCSSFEYGLVGENDEHVQASIGKKLENEEKRIFFISDRCTNKSEIIAAAIHEFTHLWHDGHYEEYASKMTEVIGKYIAVSFSISANYSQGILI